jgi:two-component system CheB/CheR fusion protein
LSKRPTPEPKLRRRAEARVSREVDGKPIEDAEALRLVHELKIHQIELEMQNEELRATRLALEGALGRFTALFDFAPVGYFVLGREGQIREVSFAGARLLGRLRAKIVGRRLDSFVSERDQGAFRRFAEAALAVADDDDPDDEDTLAPAPLEVSIVTTHGERMVRFTASRVERQPARVALLSAEDVTERRAAEDALHEALRRRDDFLGTLSHELRNPLAPIRNGLYLLQRAEPGSDGARRATAVIDRQIVHLTRLVDDLLDVTRIARGKLQLQPLVEDVGELVRRTVEDHRAAFDGAGVHLATALAPDCWADVDPTRIVQVIGNLLGNALKFTRPGDRVDVSLQPERGLLLLRVRDTGSGIAPDLLERLFEPFTQGPQTLARSAGGLGLGLATVRGIVELHGGTVEIRSPGVGHGTLVTIALPEATLPRPEPSAPAIGAAAHRRVLVVDDNPDAATSLKEVLETCGHEVRAALDADHGLEAARSFHPNVILCDLGLPGADGYSFARAVRAEEGLRSAFLVALSGYARADDVQRSMEAGFDRHVAKPASLERLEALLAEVP